MQMHTLSQVIVQDLTDTKTPEDREDTRTVALIHTHIILHLCMCMHTWTPVATQHLKSDQSTHRVFGLERIERERRDMP